MDLGFIGSISASLDDKGRVAIPAKFRKRLTDIDPEMGGTVIVTVSDRDECLWLYPMSEWSLVRQRLATLPTTNRRNRMMRQRLLGGAADLDLDSNGRILLNTKQRDHAGLKKQVLFVGQDNMIELWEESAWERHLQKIDELTATDEDSDAVGSIEYDQLRL